MGKNNNRFPGQKGIVNFLPLVMIAILLIGFVGYFSVSRLRDKLNSNVLGDSNNTTSIESDLEGELEMGSQDLDSVGDINETVSAGVEFKSSPVPSSQPLESGTGSGVYSQTDLVVDPKVVGYKPTYKFLGVVNIKLSEDSSLLRYLGFLFTK